jgi:hypothetical protein
MEELKRTILFKKERGALVNVGRIGKRGRRWEKKDDGKNWGSRKKDIMGRRKWAD